MQRAFISKLCGVAAALAVSSIVAAQASPPAFPVGVVVSPAGNTIPSAEQQRFHYEWISRLGLNIIEHEFIPVADGFLSWDYIEPTPGQYNWKPYDSAVRDCEATGLHTMLEVMTWRSVPQWFYDANPDALMVTPLGGDKLTVMSRDPVADLNNVPSMAHRGLAEAAERYVREIAKRYRDHDVVMGYIIGDEQGLNGIWPPLNYYGIDCSPAMHEVYHRRLKEKYDTIEALNAAWDCPGRYDDFTDIVWRRGWAHEPKKYRGEWLSYYQNMMWVFADFHNRIARAIHEEDPDAIVMLSQYETIVNRVGHGAYLPYFTEADAVAYKSYWNDVRWSTDYLAGASGGKAVWCSNLSERETTSGPAEQKRYMEAQYVRRATWASYARGLKGTFLFLWSPVQNDYMALLEPTGDGGVEPLPAIYAAADLAKFFDRWQPKLERFKPALPRVLVLDPNTTFLAQHWDYADASAERIQMQANTPAIHRFHNTLDLLAKHNRRFDVATEENLSEKLQTGVDLLVLTGNDCLHTETSQAIRKWIAGGGVVIVDDRTADFDALGRAVGSLDELRDQYKALVLKGQRWDQDAKQCQRFADFLDEHVPLDYKVPGRNGERDGLVTADRMIADSGDEMWVIVRRGAGGQPHHTLEVELDWLGEPAACKTVDPWAAPGEEASELSPPSQDTPSVVTLRGDQDVLLVIANMPRD